MSLSRSTALRTQLRERKCTVCAEKFKQARAMQSVCSPLCAAVQGRQDTAKKAVKEAKESVAADRKALREFRAANKKKGEYLSEAQAAFNAYIRFRDRDQACICCGSFDARNAGGVGGGWDAGHWISRGHASHLRFDERNVHKQRKGCNRPGGTTRAKYRLGLVARIGGVAVLELEALEYAPTEKRWTVEELVQVTKTYRAKLKAIKEAA
jgi:hypothetical protein